MSRRTRVGQFHHLWYAYSIATTLMRLLTLETILVATDLTETSSDQLTTMSTFSSAMPLAGPASPWRDSQLRIQTRSRQFHNTQSIHTLSW